MGDNAVVLDSSVIASLFFPEKYSEWSEDLVKKFTILLTTDLAYAEISNVAWKRVHLLNQEKTIVMENLIEAVNFISEVCEVVAIKNIYRESLELAIKLKITFYDAAFLSIALEKKIPLATLDKKLVNVIKDTELNNFIMAPYDIK